MEVAAARRALAEEDERGDVVPAHARRPRHADRVRDLGADERRDARDARGLPERRIGRVAALPASRAVPKTWCAYGRERHPAPEGGGELARAREDPVLVAHRGRGRADDGGLLAEGARVAGDGPSRWSATRRSSSARASTMCS